MHKTWALFLDLGLGNVKCFHLGYQQLSDLPMGGCQSAKTIPLMLFCHAAHVFDILKNHVRARTSNIISVACLHSTSHSHIYLDKENLKYLLCLWPLTSQYSFQDSCWVERNPPFIWVYERNIRCLSEKKREYCHRYWTRGIKRAANWECHNSL